MQIIYIAFENDEQRFNDVFQQKKRSKYLTQNTIKSTIL